MSYITSRLEYTKTLNLLLGRAGESRWKEGKKGRSEAREKNKKLKNKQGRKSELNDDSKGENVITC